MSSGTPADSIHAYPRRISGGSWGADFAGFNVLRNDEGILKAKLP